MKLFIDCGNWGKTVRSATVEEVLAEIRQAIGSETESVSVFIKLRDEGREGGKCDSSL